MLILVSAAILSLTSIVILVARARRSRFGLAWLAAVAGSLAAFLIALMAKPDRPQIIALGSWQPRVLLPASPVLLIDAVSWSLAVAVLALNLAAALTAVQHFSGSDRPDERPLDLASCLLLAAAAALAVAAGNLLSLLLLWTAIDLITAFIRLPRAKTYRRTEIILFVLAVRLAGTWLLVWAGLLSSAEGLPTALTTISSDTAALVLAAVILRVVIPLPAESEKSLRSSGLHALSELLPAAAVWAAAVRVAAAEAPGFGQALIWLGALAAIYGGLRVFTAASTRAALPFWVLGISGWTVGCAVQGRPYAALAVSLGGLLFGGLLRLAEVRPRSAFILLLAGAVLFSGLPLTPTWPVVGLYAPPLHPAVVLYFLSFCALLAGFARQALRRAPPPPAAERWFWVIYPLGLALLPIFSMILAWNLRPGSPGGLPAWPGWVESAVGAIALGSALALTAAVYRSRRRFSAAWNNGLQPKFLFSAIRGLFTRLRRLESRINWALEGRAGLIWALLVLALLVSVFAQLGGAAQP